MRRITGLAAAMGTVVLAGCGDTTRRVPVAAPPTITLPVCGAKPVIRPREIMLACADGNNGVGRLTWRDWGGPIAWGDGLAYSNDCVPNCAQGGFHYAPAEVYARRASSCPQQYSSMSIIVEQGPLASLSGVYSLPCPPDAEPQPRRTQPEFESEADTGPKPTEAEVRQELEIMKAVERRARAER